MGQTQSSGCCKGSSTREEEGRDVSGRQGSYRCSSKSSLGEDQGSGRGKGSNGIQSSRETEAQADVTRSESQTVRDDEGQVESEESWLEAEAPAAKKKKLYPDCDRRPAPTHAHSAMTQS